MSDSTFQFLIGLLLGAFIMGFSALIFTYNELDISKCVEHPEWCKVEKEKLFNAINGTKR